MMNLKTNKTFTKGQKKIKKKRTLLEKKIHKN